MRLVHFLADQLCGWQPTPLAKWLMQHIHYTLVETSVDWMSSEQHSYGHLLQVDLPRGTWYAHSLAVAYADFPFRLAGWMQSIGSKFDLGFVLDLLHLDDHEFSRQVVARLSGSQDRTTATLSSAQVKDLVLDNMVITGQTVEWLSTIARRLLRPLPLKALTVLTHAFLPQLTYGGETAIASQPFVSLFCSRNCCLCAVHQSVKELRRAKEQRETKQHKKKPNTGKKKTKQANQTNHNKNTTTKTPQPSKIPLLQVKQVKRVRRNPHWIGKKLVNEELVRGKLRLPTNEHGNKLWIRILLRLMGRIRSTTRQTANKNNTNNKNKQNQTNQKTTNEPEPSHQRGETKSEVRHAPD